MKNCPNLQKSLDWCEGMPQLPGIRRRLYYTSKNLIVAWPQLVKDEFGRVTEAYYQGAFELAEDAFWQYIDINIDKSTVTSEPQGEVPSQTQLNKATFIHNGIDDAATAAAGFLNNADCVIVFEDMRGHFRVLGNDKWRTLITVNQDQGQGTNPASTTINVEVTDVIAPPFYAEGLVTEDGEVFPHANESSEPQPRLTSPTASSFDIGVIADSGSSVSKQMLIKGVDLTQPLTLAKTGSGLTVSKPSVTAEEANAGIYVTLTYTKSTAGAGSLNGSLNISSGEGIDKTVTVTAKKAALTSPSEATIDVGTIASDGSSVQKSITVKGANLTKRVSLSVTGTGFSINKTSLTALQANTGTTVDITYNNTASGAASAKGTLMITSDEVSKTVALAAAKAAPAATPALTSPTVTSFDIGTIAHDGTTVSKSLLVRAENITMPLEIEISGEGFTANRDSIPVDLATAGIMIQLGYTKREAGATSATGSLRIFSSEGIDKTVTLTAAKEAEQETVETMSIPLGLPGPVCTPDGGEAGMVAIDMIGSEAITTYPQTSKRAMILVPVSEKFPRIPKEKIHFNTASGDISERNFIFNDVTENYTFIQAKNVDKFLFRRLSGKADHYSIGVGSLKKLTGGKMLVTSIRSWAWETQLTLISLNIKADSNYSANDEYCLMSNAKKGSDGTTDFAQLNYREDFDVMILPNNWLHKQLMPTTSYQSHFPNLTGQWPNGMVMYGEWLVQFFNTGRIVVLNKDTREFVAAGAMNVAEEDMHCNAVSVGTQTPNGGMMPYVYVSQWTSGKCSCHVMDISWQDGVVTCTRVQKITYMGPKFNSDLEHDWSVDAKTGKLWCYGYAAEASDRFGAKTALQFNLPDLATANVTYLDADIIAEKSFSFNGLMQDTHIENDMMFFLFGYDNAKTTGGVLIIDLNLGTLFSNNIIDLQETGLELEGITRDGSKLIITTHEPGVNTFDFGIIEIDLLQSNISSEV